MAGEIFEQENQGWEQKELFPNINKERERLSSILSIEILNISDEIMGELLNIWEWEKSDQEMVRKITGFLYTPNQSLWNMAPIEILATDWGEQEILDLLGRIKYWNLA